MATTHLLWYWYVLTAASYCLPTLGSESHQRIALLMTTNPVCSVTLVPNFMKKQQALRKECKCRAMIWKMFYNTSRNKKPDSWGILGYNKKLLGFLLLLKLPLSTLPKIDFILQSKLNPILSL